MTTRAERATVLAVHQRPPCRQRYERRLGDEYEVLTAESGAGALDMLHDGVDVVLLDRGIAETSSDEVLFSIRAAGYDCRVAMVADEEPPEDVVAEGFDALLVEPVSREELTRTVERLLARSTYESQLEELYQLCVKRARTRADGGVNGSDEDDSAHQGDDSDGENGAGDVESGDVAEIEARIREIRESVDETVSSFETTDYRASFRDLPKTG